MNRYLLIILLSISVPIHLLAQNVEKDTIFDTSSKTFLIIPLVTNNPAMKTGFGAMPMFFFKFNPEDEVSPPSVLSLYGIYSTNKSYVFVGSARLFWNEDKNRATIITGPIRINNDFTYTIEGEDVQLVFSELRNFITLEYSRKIIGNFYLGALYLGTKTKYKFDQGTDEENEFTKDFLRKMILPIILFQVSV